MRWRIDEAVEYSYINAECPQCGYDLRGASGTRCSDCGHWFEWDEWRAVRDWRGQCAVGAWLGLGSVLVPPFLFGALLGVSQATFLRAPDWLLYPFVLSLAVVAVAMQVGVYLSAWMLSSNLWSLRRYRQFRGLPPKRSGREKLLLGVLCVLVGIFEAAALIGMLAYVTPGVVGCTRSVISGWIA